MRNMMQWVAETIEQGPHIDLDKKPSKMDDYELATLIKFHVDQLRRNELDFSTLDIWPWVAGELFNRDNCKADAQYHDTQLVELRKEWERRRMP